MNSSPFLHTSFRSIGTEIYAYRREILLGLALIFLTYAALGGVIDCGFVDYDDDIYVTRNLDVLQGISFEAIASDFTTTRSNHWHPLTWLSLQSDVEACLDGQGLQPSVFHRTNLILHIANVLLLFGLLRRITGSAYRSAVVAGLFAVHPLHVESVAWVTERKDVLSTLFWLVATLAYVIYTEKATATRYGLFLIAYVLGLLSKPMLITLPVTLLLLDYWPLRRFATRSMQRVLSEKAPLFCLALASAVMSLRAQQLGGGIKSGEYFSVGERVGNAINAYGIYLFQTTWPVNLAPFYPVPAGGFSELRTTCVAMVLLLLTAIPVRAAWRCPYLIVGWLWYLVTLAPVSGVVQLGSYAHADRYTYVPSIGLFIALVWGITALVPRLYRPRLLLPAAALVLAIAVFLSRNQVATWHDSLALWEHACAVTPDNFIARTHLASAYQETGRLDEAEASFVDAVKLRPDLALARFNLGQNYLRQGKLNCAEQCFREAIAIEPDEARYRLRVDSRAGEE
jgi:hypothetical protein